MNTLRHLSYQKSMPLPMLLLGLSLLGVAGNGLFGVPVGHSSQIIKYLWLTLIGLALTLKGFGSLAWDRLSRLRTKPPG
jgi:hypothetical protein